jgi:hypothetical protein
MLNRMCCVFVKLIVLSVLVMTVGAVGCGRGTTGQNSPGVVSLTLLSIAQFAMESGSPFPTRTHGGPCTGGRNVGG